MFFCIPATADQVGGARNVALGGLQLAPKDIFSAVNHPASLCWNVPAGIAINASKPYIIANLHDFSLAAHLPTPKAGNFFLTSSFKGTSFMYNLETKIGYAKLLSKQISLATAFNYNRWFIQEYNARNFYNFELGLTYKPKPFLDIGFQLKNPIPWKVNNYNNQRTPVILKTGISYFYKEKLIVALEYVQNLKGKPEFRFGLEYSPHKRVAFQTGYNSTAHAVSLGSSLLFKNIRCEFSCNWKPSVGFTPAMGIQFLFPPKTKTDEKK